MSVIRKFSMGVLTNRLFRVILISFLLYTLLSLAYNVYSVDNVRYLVSALIQSQAAVLAIVISLTLVGVQLSAQKYTPRLIEIFIQDKYFWRLFLFYIISITLGCVLLYMLQENPCYITVSFYLFSTKAAFCLGLVLFMLALYVVLVIESLYLLKPYTKYILNLLKPENVARKVAESIKITDIEKYGFGLKTINPLTPVYELCRNIIDARDEEAAARCAWSLEELFTQSHNMFVEKYSVLKKTTYSANKEKLEEEMRIVTAYGNVVELFVDVIFKLFMQSIDRGLYNASRAFISALGGIGATITSIGGIASATSTIVIQALKMIDYRIGMEVAKLKEIYKYEYLLPYEVYSLVNEPILSLKDIAIQDVRNVKNTATTVINEILQFLRETIDSIHETDHVLVDPFMPERGSVKLSAVLKVFYGILDEIVKQIINSKTTTTVERTSILDRDYTSELIRVIEAIEQAINISIQYRWEDLLWETLFYLWSLSLELYNKGFNIQAKSILNRLQKILIRGYDVTYYLIKIIINSMEGKVREHIDIRGGSLNTSFIYDVVNTLVALYKFASQKHDRPPDFILGAPESLGSIVNKLIRTCNDDIALSVIDKLSEFCDMIKCKEGNDWRWLFDEGIRWLVYIGVSLLQKANKHGAQKVIEKIHDLVEADKHCILGILDTIENSGEYGICIEDISKRDSGEFVPAEELCPPILLGDHDREYLAKFRNMLLNYFNQR